jgi:hypothetical protein
VECREHGVRVEQVPWAAHDSHFTREFEEMVAWLAQRMDSRRWYSCAAGDWCSTRRCQASRKLTARENPLADEPLPDGEPLMRSMAKLPGRGPPLPMS